MVKIELSPEMVRAAREAKIASVEEGEDGLFRLGVLQLQSMVFDQLVVELGLPWLDEKCGHPDWYDPRVSKLWNQYVEILAQLNRE